MLFSTRRCFKDRATRAQSAGWAHLLAKKRTNVGWLVTQYRFTPGGNTRSAHARAMYRLYASSSSRKSWWSGWITSMPALKKPLQDDRGGDVQKQTRKADAQGNPAKGVRRGVSLISAASALARELSLSASLTLPAPGRRDAPWS